MNLSVLERLVTNSILPREGDYVTLRILQNLKLSLSFTEEEIKLWEISTQDNHTVWNDEAARDVDIPIGEKATDIIVESLKKLNKEKKLTEQMMSIYEKFIPVPD